MKTIIIQEKDWKTSVYRTREWERTVNITKWTHEFGIHYIIEYEEL